MSNPRNRGLWKWALLFMLTVALGALNHCERNMTGVQPGVPIYTTTVVIPDPAGKRAGDYRLEATRDAWGVYLDCNGSEACYREVLKAEDLPYSNEDWNRIAAFDFSRFAYDLVVVAVPDPSYYAQLIKKSHGDGQMNLEFGVFRSPWRGAVPDVVVPILFIFRYPR